MRDLLVFPLYVALLAYSLKDPFAGVLFYYLISFADLHTLAWGFSASIPWAYLAVGITVFSWITKDGTNTRLIWNKTNVLFVVWSVWVQITTLLALNPAGAGPLWQKYIKIFGATLLFSPFYSTRQRIIAVVSVIAGSIGFYGVKGGIHGLMGATGILGPSSFSDRNDFAFACVLVLPLLWYLRTVAQDNRIRVALIGVMALTCFASLVTLSRGAFIGLLAVAIALMCKARRKVLMFFVAGAVGSILYLSLPDEFFHRMYTIESYDQDESAMSRLQSWEHALNVAYAHPVFGGGLGTFRKPVYEMFTPGARVAFEAHSIYFQVLGDQGYVGLFIFVSMLFLAWRNCRWLRHNTRARPESRWAYDLAFAFQLTLIGYAVGGVFLSQAYCELYYLLLVLMGMTRYVVARDIHVTERQANSATVTSEGFASREVLVQGPRPNIIGDRI